MLPLCIRRISFKFHPTVFPTLKAYTNGISFKSWYYWKVVINPIPLLLLNQFILNVPFTAVSFTIFFKFSYCRRSMYYCDSRTIDTILHLMAYNSCKQELLHLVTITYQVPSRTNKALTRTATATGSGVTRNMSDKVGRRSHSLRRLSEYIPKLSAVCCFSKKEIFGFAHYSLEDVQGDIRKWKSSFLTQLSKAAKLNLHALFADRVWIHICNGVYPKWRIKTKNLLVFRSRLIFNKLKRDII